MKKKTKLGIDNVYRVNHKRKGIFVGLLMDIVPAFEGDEEDDVFLYMKIDTRVGTGQEGLMGEAGRAGKHPVKLVNIRPSLVTSIEPLEGESWLREIKAVGEDKIENKPEPKLLEKLKGLFG